MARCRCVIPFGDEEEAVAIANGTDYGLAASIWSDSGARQMRLAKRLRAGQVFVNTYGAGGGVELPFGGVGKSGHGREKGIEALYGLSVLKTVAAHRWLGIIGGAGMRLEGKRAIVTGAGSGFGMGIARKFAAEGCEVVVADINGDAAAEIATEIGGLAIAVDVSDRASVGRMVEGAISAFGQIDIVVNNAGVTHLPGPMEEIEEAEFDRVFAVNCKSVYLMAQALVGHMKPQGGAILNVASTAGLSPAPAAKLVQRVEGLDDHRDQGDGGGTGAVRPAGECALPGGGRNAVAEELHGRRYTRVAGEVPGDDPAGSVLDPAGHGQCCVFPVF